MKDKLLTSSYPDSVRRQSDFEWIWHLLTIICIIMIVIMPAQFFLWVLLVFFALMSFTVWRASNNRSVPVIAVPIIEAMSSMSAESKQRSAEYEAMKDQANRFGIVNLNERYVSEQEHIDDSEQQRQRERRRVEEFVDDDDDEEVWKI